MTKRKQQSMQIPTLALSESVGAGAGVAGARARVRRQPSEQWLQMLPVKTVASSSISSAATAQPVK